MLEANIPEQVKAGADAADKTLAELTGKKPEDSGQDINPKPDDADVAPEKTVQLEDVDALKARVKELDDKLKVLQGKYNAEIKALGDDPQLLNTLKAENRRLTRQAADYSRIISDQQNEIARLSSAPKPEPEPKPTEPEDVKVDLSKEDLDYLENEGFDERTLKIINTMVAKRADAIAAKRYGDQPATPAPARSREATPVESTFFRDLSEAIPNWREINGTPEKPNDTWLDWLDELAPYQNRTRADVLHEAQDKLDVNTCIAIFKDFIKENGSAPQPKPDDETIRLNPEDNLEPDSKGSSSIPDDKPTYTMAEYKKHYDDLTKGLWRGRETEWQKQSDILDMAFKEGRII